MRIFKYLSLFLLTAGLTGCQMLEQEQLPPGDIPVSLVTPENVPEKSAETQTDGISEAEAESMMNGAITTALIRCGCGGQKVKVYVPFETLLPMSFETILARGGMIRISGDPQSPYTLTGNRENNVWKLTLTETASKKVLMEKTVRISK